MKKFIAMALVVLMTAMLGIGVPVVAEPGYSEYYVSPTGNDAGNGSIDAPYKTIQYAINVAPDDSIIYVKEGVYTQKLTVNGRNNLQIVNYNNETPVISGTTLKTGNLIDIRNTNGFVLKGFDVTGIYSNSFEGIYVGGISSNIEINDCRLYNLKVKRTSGNGHGIYVENYSNTPTTNIRILNNEFYNLVTGWSESCTFEGNVDGYLVDGNIFHDNTNISICATGFYGKTTITNATRNQARNGLISNNLLYDITCPYSWAAPIYIDGGRSTIIEYNTIYNSILGIEVGCELPKDETTGQPAIVKDVIVRYNLIYNCSQIGINIGGYNGTKTGKVINSQIYNNTLYNNKVGINFDYCDNITVTKNIIYNPNNKNLLIQDGLKKATNLKINDNIYFTSGTGRWNYKEITSTSLKVWQTKTGFDIISKFINPNFTSDYSSPLTGYGARSTSSTPTPIPTITPTPRI